MVLVWFWITSEVYDPLYNVRDILTYDRNTPLLCSSQ